MAVLPDLTKVVEWSKYLNAQGRGQEGLSSMHQEARQFLGFYNWCSKILESYVGKIVPGVIGIFLFKILPARKDVDEWVWVVVGDLPPAYLTCEECPNPATALDGYIGAMTEWVKAAECGDSVASLIPVNVPATKANAEKLKKRLEFLDERILSEHHEDLR